MIRTNKSTSASVKQCPLKDDHDISMCTKFKQQGVNWRCATLKKFKLCFCCLNSHLMKDCSRTECVNGCTKKHNKLLHSDSSKTETKHEIWRTLVSKQGRRFFDALNWYQWFLTVDTNFSRKRATKR